MNEDPTRLMNYGDEPPRRRRPPQQKPKGNLRLVVAVMGAVIFGLLIALLVSCGGGETKTVTQTRTITREVEAQGSQEKETGEEGESEEGEGTEGEGLETEEAERLEAEEAERLEAEEAEGAGGIEGEEGEIVPEIEEFEGEPEGGGVGTE